MHHADGTVSSIIFKINIWGGAHRICDRIKPLPRPLLTQSRFALDLGIAFNPPTNVCFLSNREKLDQTLFSPNLNFLATLLAGCLPRPNKIISFQDYVAELKYTINEIHDDRLEEPEHNLYYSELLHQMLPF